MFERNLSADEVSYVIQHGQVVRDKGQRAGARSYFLSSKRVPVADKADHRVQQLVNTTVLVDEVNGVILTVYRNKNGLKDHSRKQKYNRRDPVA
jgi:hypothetical protein